MHFDELRDAILEVPKTQLPAILIMTIKKCMKDEVFSNIRTFIDLTVRHVESENCTRCRKCGVEVEGELDICAACLFPVDDVIHAVLNTPKSETFRKAGVDAVDAAEGVEEVFGKYSSDSGCSKCGRIRPIIKDGLCFECAK
jgi:ribosomal protein L37E